MFLILDSTSAIDALKRYVHFDIATRRSRIHRSNDSVNVIAQRRPLLIADHHKRDSAAFQVLLVPHVLVRRQQDLEPSCLSNRYQFGVNKPVPSAFNSFDNDVALQA
jgi:hypothetical protein